MVNCLTFNKCNHTEKSHVTENYAYLYNNRTNGAVTFTTVQLIHIQFSPEIQLF